MLRVASRAGLDDLPDVPSLALGSGLVTPLAITTAFSVFPNGGFAVRPRDIARVRDADGGTAFEQRVDTERVIAPEVAFQMVSMLRDAIDRGTGSRRPGNSAFAFRSAARPARPTNSRTPGSSASHRRSSSACGSATISRNRSAPRRTARDTRCRSGRTSCSVRRASGRRRSSNAPRAWRKRRYARSAIASPLTDARSIPSSSRKATTFPIACARIHRGSIRQRLTRTVQGWMSEAGRRIRGIFR